MSILLVEDDVFTRDLLEDILTKAGLKVQAVSDGEEAIDCLEQGHAFDLLMTDIKLPGLHDGWSTAIEVRRFIPEIPVIYMTASHQQSCPVSRSVYLRKPMKPKLLLSVITALLGRQVASDTTILNSPALSIGVPSYIH